MSKQFLSAVARGLRQRPEPPEGRQCIQVDPLAFVVGDEIFQFNTSAVGIGDISGIRSIWIDATGCTPGKNIYIETVYQTFVIAGGKQGYITVVADVPFSMRVRSDAGLTGTCNVNLYNFEIWPGESQSIQTIAGAISVAQQPGAWVDNVTEIGGAAISLGQKDSAHSLPVVLPSDQVVAVKSQGGAVAAFGQQLVAVAAAQLPAIACRKVKVRAPAANAASVFIGGAGVTVASGYELIKGDSQEFEVSNANQLYYIGNAGDHISWIAVS